MTYTGRFRRISYFADVADHLDLMRNLERHFEVRYVQSHKDIDEAPLSEWKAADQIVNFGVSETGEELGDLRLLILPRADAPVPSYAYTDPNGGRRFHYSASGNQNAIDFMVGGKLTDIAVISSSMAVDADLTWAKQYFSSLQSHCKRSDWRRVRGVLVSPGAIELHAQGYRLTQSVRASKTIDLRID